MGSSTPWGSYARIADSLRERLAALEPGSPVPSETALSQEHDVVRNTIRRALAELQTRRRDRCASRLRSRGAHPGCAVDVRPSYQRIATNYASRSSPAPLRPALRCRPRPR